MKCSAGARDTGFSLLDTIPFIMRPLPFRDGGRFPRAEYVEQRVNQHVLVELGKFGDIAGVVTLADGR